MNGAKSTSPSAAMAEAKKRLAEATATFDFSRTEISRIRMETDRAISAAKAAVDMASRAMTAAQTEVDRLRQKCKMHVHPFRAPAYSKQLVVVKRTPKTVFAKRVGVEDSRADQYRLGKSGRFCAYPEPKGYSVSSVWIELAEDGPAEPGADDQSSGAGVIS